MAEPSSRSRTRKRMASSLSTTKTRPLRGAEVRASSRLIAPASEREAASETLAALVTEYIADLRARRRSKKHVTATEHRLRVILSGTGWKRLSDIRADGFVHWRGTLKRAAQTVREYHAAMNMFMNWLLRLERIARNPLAKVPQVDARPASPRHSRSDGR